MPLTYPQLDLLDNHRSAGAYLTGHRMTVSGIFSWLFVVGCTGKACLALAVSCTGKLRFGVCSRLHWEGPLQRQQQEGPLRRQQLVALGRPDSALAVDCTGKAGFDVSSKFRLEGPLRRQLYVALGRPNSALAVAMLHFNCPLRRQQQVALGHKVRFMVELRNS